MPFPATHPALARALEAQGYAEPTPVQAAVLEAAADRDLLVSAQTGSGKTVAFGLAAAEPLLGAAERFDSPGSPLGLVIAPTRELAMQVSRELTWLYAETGARVVACVGGMDPRREQRELSAGAHIVVGTPGRLRDHLERGNLDASALRVVVLDEADEMLDLGFREDLEEILDAAPAERRTLLFSATIARDIASLARKFQKDAVRIDTTRLNEVHGDIEYRAMRVAPNEVEKAVVNTLRLFESPGALVFCNTREAVRRLHGALRERGFAAVALSGEMAQKERSDALQALRDGHARACVATDVAARGLDLPDLGLVIHAELPINKAGLLHRSGRTGRAGKKGVSVLLVPYTRRRKIEQLLGSAGIDAEWSGPPSAEEIRAKDQARLLEDPVLTATPSPEDLELAGRILAGSSPEAVAAALVRLHRSRLPEPEELFDDVRDAKGPDGKYPERPDRPDRADRPERDPKERWPAMGQGEAGGGWFRLTVGRRANADPKWLIPLICRLGHVTKKDIGAIRIFDTETKFEISAEAIERFRNASRDAGQEGDIRLEETSAPGPRGPRPPRSYEERPPHAGERSERKTYEQRKPREDGPRPERKPYADRAPRTEDGPRPERKPYAERAARPDAGPPAADAPRPFIRPRTGDAPRPDRKPRPDFKAGPGTGPAKAKTGYPKKKPGKGPPPKKPWTP